MANSITIALSGLNAASSKIAATATNIANANTSGAREGTDGPKAYTPVDIIEISQKDGVKTEAVARDPATSLAYDPNSSFADSEGLVEAPNVDYGTEIVTAKLAALAYKANASVIKIASEMEQELLNRIDERA